ncbi:MAG: hypothetical protein IJN57_06980 [Oscillospiraceae bacterium]|nr:hypothetical protein [Oscillospiraceae bacterium]
MNAPQLIADGIPLPTPAREGITVTANKLWSENAGRNTATGKFVGDVIAVKHTVSIVYETLSEEEMQLLFDLTAAVNPWHTLIFPYKGTTKKINCYFADVGYTMRRFDRHERRAYYCGVTLEAVEQ